MEINLSINNNNIEQDFLRIASELMNSWVLKIETAEYRITEIEFYFNSSFHNDDYAHSHILQKESGRWYFHGSGVDLTFGSKDIYGGILIRAIYNLKSQNYIYGPINCITEIFSNLTTIYESKFNFGLVPANNKKLDFEKVISAPRVGLNEKKNPEMINKYYRYLIMPQQKHAEKTKIANAMKQQGFSDIEIKKIWR